MRTAATGGWLLASKEDFESGKRIVQPHARPDVVTILLDERAPLEAVITKSNITVERLTDTIVEYALYLDWLPWRTPRALTATAPARSLSTIG